MRVFVFSLREPPIFYRDSSKQNMCLILLLTPGSNNTYLHTGKNMWIRMGLNKYER